MTPSQIAYEAAGSPTVASAEIAQGRCYVCCCELTTGVPVQQWLGSNYTDQNRARWPTATHICPACVYVHAWVAPPGRAAKKGSDRGPQWRQYSHLWEEDIGYSNASKAEKPVIRAFIERDHAGSWFAAIANTGQKHVLPFTPLNGPGRIGSVLMDELRIVVPNDTSLIQRMADLLTAGAKKGGRMRIGGKEVFVGGIVNGRYERDQYEKLGDILLQFEHDEGRFRGSPWFTLALWLAQRDEEEVQRRMATEKEAKKNARRSKKGKAPHANSGAGARSPKRVSARRSVQRAEALGATRNAAQGSGSDEQQSRGAGNSVCEKPAASGPIQGRLPGFD